MSPNIRPAVEPHSECWRQKWDDRPLLGDVRRCVHGRIQVLTEVSIHSRAQGPGMNWWRTLSPVFNPILHRRAKEVLG